VAVALVLLATAGAAVGAASVFSVDRDLSVGTIRLSTDPGHRGALDIYVPLVDWGVRFDAVRLPARLSLDLRSLDRDVVRRVASGGRPDVEGLREEAEAAITSYIERLVAFVLAVALGLGALVAFALRGRVAPVKLTLPVVGLCALGAAVAVATLLPPRGAIENPQYYANGPDIPAALRAIDQAQGSAGVISEELNDQLIGLARLIAAPSARVGERALPRLTLASDLHNNLLALPALERAAAGGPLVFAGDLTDRGSPFEAALTARIARAGRPVVLVPGNHDSDALSRRLARAGVVVLGERGRLLANGRRGPVVARVAGLRVAGYESRNMRRASERYRDRGAAVSDEQRAAFAAWLRPLLGEVDVVVVHEPGLAEAAGRELRDEPPERPLALLTGHTHRAAVTSSANLVELNGGSVGGGGTGNLGDDEPFSLAVLVFDRAGGFTPRYADTVEIDAGSGSARAERHSLDDGS
jgi:predicted phosphodiesterase